MTTLVIIQGQTSPARIDRPAILIAHVNNPHTTETITISSSASKIIPPTHNELELEAEETAKIYSAPIIIDNWNMRITNEEVLEMLRNLKNVISHYGQIDCPDCSSKKARWYQSPYSNGFYSITCPACGHYEFTAKTI